MTRTGKPDTQENKIPESKAPPVKEEEKDNGAETPAIENLEEGESLAIEGLSFEPGRHVLQKSSIPVLEDLLKTLKKHKNLKIAIEGHVCCVQGAADGIDVDTGKRNLSLSRAKAVHDYLVKHGIDRNRLSYKGFGHDKPRKSPEITPEDEQENRRVEIRVIHK